MAPARREEPPGAGGEGDRREATDAIEGMAVEPDPGRRCDPFGGRQPACQRVEHVEREERAEPEADRPALGGGVADARELAEGGDHAPGLAGVVPGQIDGAQQDQLGIDRVARGDERRADEGAEEQGGHADRRPAMGRDLRPGGIEEAIGRHEMGAVDEDRERDPVRVREGDLAAVEQDVDEHGAHADDRHAPRQERVPERGRDRRPARCRRSAHRPLLARRPPRKRRGRQSFDHRPLFSIAFPPYFYGRSNRASRSLGDRPIRRCAVAAGRGPRRRGHRIRPSRSCRAPARA